MACGLVARYLHDRDLQREIHDGLNVAEGWNGGNQVLFCLHVLQAAVAYVNALLVQDVLAEPGWAGELPPLFRTHVAPYGEVKLSTTKRLALRGDTPDQ